MRKFIVITGPESTGKTTLAAQLAGHFNGEFVPEYARSYVENLNRSYTYKDVEYIARKQIEAFSKYEKVTGKPVFFDTFLIITKVWFTFVYKKYPAWLPEAISASHVDLFLLCNTDLPWVPDGVRENGGEVREQLFQMYKEELETCGFSYKIVTGEGQERINRAINYVYSLF